MSKIDEGIGSYQPWGRSRLQQAREELNDVEFTGLLKDLQEAPFNIKAGEVVRINTPSRDISDD